MGKLETIYRNLNRTLSEEQVRDRLHDLKRDMHLTWEQHKQYHEIMHGTEIKDNTIDMVLVYLIKKRVFDRDE